MTASSHYEREMSVKWPASPNARLVQHYWPFASPCAPRRLHPQPQSDRECRVEPKGKPRLVLMMPMLIFPQSSFTQPTTALALLHHTPTLSGHHSHLCDNPQLRRAVATIPHEKLPVLRDPVFQICKASSSVILIAFSL